MSPRNDKEATNGTPQECGFQNKTQTMAMLVDILTQKEKDPLGSDC